MIVVAFVLIAAWLALIAGFVWMICLGALSHIFDVPELAIGYWQSVLVAFIVNVLLGGAIRGKE